MNFDIMNNDVFSKLDGDFGFIGNVYLEFMVINGFVVCYNQFFFQFNCYVFFEYNL